MTWESGEEEEESGFQGSKKVGSSVLLTDVGKTVVSPFRRYEFQTNKARNQGPSVSNSLLLVSCYVRIM